MYYEYIVIALGVAPFIWLYFSFLNVRKGKRDQVNWKGPLGLYIGLCLLILVIAIYQKYTYDIPIFINSSSFISGLIVSGGLFAIIGLVNIFVTFRYRKNPLPKDLHDPKVVWILGVIICLGIFVFMSWFFPAGKKMNYTSALNNAYSELEEDNDEEIGLVLATSEERCMRRRDCDFKVYNVFYAKNNLEKTQDVQFLIRTIDKNGEQQKEIESKVITMEPGEIKLVETEETNSSSEMWMKYSFTTDNWFDGYQYRYRYRDNQ
ncbi:hypothetical protein [Piscibacillus halophilus]|uniref:Uncharacterized protein n=1 Tax=Piscibacillus halophilus TaxID=571933 RepID=A0A1H9CA42_9BACI|nr:hypothetical protein [Piscibacillus halophilus]SEP97837.1 hypothetical protein SAMN05216362_1053 [Piscibacillus halophilus]